VDALRGIAALSVVAFHVYKKTLYAPLSAPPLPQPIHWYLRHGDLGVAVFFVISGYVIASSIAKARITPGFVARFALRRSIRLDPPYWATIALELALIVISQRILHDQATLPSGAMVISHLAYAQSILGYGHVVAVFWTLCIEVQLYLCFVALSGLAQRLGKYGLAITFVPTIALSLSLPFFFDVFAQNTYLVRYWYLFFGGVVVFWTLEGRVRATWPITFALVIALTLITPLRSLNAVAMLCTAGAIWLAGRNGGLTTWLSGPVLQWLGRISYSLYLVHMPISGRAINAASRLMRLPLNTSEQLLLLAVGIAVSLGSAQLLYVLVERPTLALSKRIRKYSSHDAPLTEPVLVQQDGLQQNAEIGG